MIKLNHRTMLCAALLLGAGLSTAGCSTVPDDFLEGDFAANSSHASSPAPAENSRT